MCTVDLMTIEISCPSGLVFEANPIGGSVFVNVGDADRASSERALLTTLRTCHVRTIDPGPYPFAREGTGSPDWDRVLFADLLYSMFKLRIGSFTEARSTLGFTNALTKQDDDRPIGQMYEFEWSCAAVDCRKLCEAVVDLGPICDGVTAITEEMRVAIANQKDLVTNLPGGLKAFWTYSRMALDEPMKKLMKGRLNRSDGSARRKESSVEIVAKHLTRVTNPEGKTVAGPDLFTLHKWLMQPGSAENIDILQSHIELRQPSVDNEVQLICTHCETEQKRVLPFVGPFFFPRSSPQAKRSTRAMMEKAFRATAEASEGSEALLLATSSPSSSPA